MTTQLDPIRVIARELCFFFCGPAPVAANAKVGREAVEHAKTKGMAIGLVDARLRRLHKKWNVIRVREVFGP